jgi:hypothetical protein
MRCRGSTLLLSVFPSREAHDLVHRASIRVHVRMVVLALQRATYREGWACSCRVSVITRKSHLQVVYGVLPSRLSMRNSPAEKMDNQTGFESIQALP